jgi:preprotein translocase subunit SecE
MTADSAGGAGFDPKRMVAVFYVAAAIALGYFFERLFALGFGYARINDPAIFGEDWARSTVLGFALAAAAAIVTWRTPRAHAVSLEIAAELKRVTWPTLRETRAATVAVVVATFVAAAILGLFDAIWAKLSSLVY